ncbi:glycosyltransferase family 2 protein [Frigidibacter sp. MR17.24]|uniref:glycosyltransferase family 2 protein n=1 Tax=Frigidibacter sp. MR17.24 TaxID=3127345 RepID=UPI003012D25B
MPSHSATAPPASATRSHTSRPRRSRKPYARQFARPLPEAVHRGPPEVVLDEIRVRPAVPAPRLAVVISCYNYERFVGDAIASVLAQGRDDCEVIVVDDGSTDGSWQAIRAAGVNAVSIRNLGARRACLAGLDRTTAPFVLFLDADDRLAPGAFDRILAHLDPGVAKLQFSLTRIGAEGEVLGAAIPKLDDFRKRTELAAQVLRTGVYVSPPTSGNVFRRDVCALMAEADYDPFVDGVTLFAAPFFGDIVSLSDELGCYRVHGTNVSGQGQRPDERGLTTDLDRFVARMAHLRAVLARLPQRRRLARTEAMYYFLEHRICAELAAGRRAGLGRVTRLIGAIRHEPKPLKDRCTLAALFLLMALLPRARAQSLMAYRYHFGARSARGVVDAILLRP